MPTPSGRRRSRQANGRWLDDIKGAKKYEARKLRLPGERGGDEGEHLAGDFVDDHMRGIVAMAGARGEGCGGDSDGGGQRTVGQGSGDEQVRRQGWAISAQVSTAPSEPQVPGPGLSAPAPKKVATVHAQ